jgi:hypothetical protein
LGDCLPYGPPKRGRSVGNCAPPPGNAIAAQFASITPGASPKIWPDPEARYLRPELPEPPALPLLDVFGPTWGPWIAKAAEAKAAPPDYVAAALLAVSGALIGNTRWASPWAGWAEPPILWAMTIGTPSMNKSPGFDAVLGPLKKLEREARKQSDLALSDYKDRAEVAKLAESAWREAAKAALRDGKEPPTKTRAEGLLLSYMGKLPGIAVRLSLILAFLDYAATGHTIPQAINLDAFDRAAHFVEAYALPMARRAYADASIPKPERAARRLASIILEKRMDRFSSREILQMEREGLRTKADLDPALLLLEEASIIRRLDPQPGPKGGAPTRTFESNPAKFGRK